MKEVMLSLFRLLERLKSAIVLPKRSSWGSEKLLDSKHSKEKKKRKERYAAVILLLRKGMGKEWWLFAVLQAAPNFELIFKWLLIILILPKIIIILFWAHIPKNKAYKLFPKTLLQLSLYMVAYSLAYWYIS